MPRSLRRAVDVDPARRSLDPHLAAREDTVQTVVPPDRRAVDAVDPVASDRKSEVVRLWQGDEQHVKGA